MSDNFQERWVYFRRCYSWQWKVIPCNAVGKKRMFLLTVHTLLYQMLHECSEADRFTPKLWYVLSWANLTWSHICKDNLRISVVHAQEKKNFACTQKLRAIPVWSKRLAVLWKIYTHLQQKWRLFLFYFLFNKMCIMNIDRMVNVRNKMSSKTTHVFVVKVTVNIRYVTWKYFMVFVQFQFI